LFEPDSKPKAFELSSAFSSNAVSFDSKPIAEHKSNPSIHIDPQSNSNAQTSADKENSDHSSFAPAEQLLRHAVSMQQHRSSTVHSDVRPNSSNINNIWSHPEEGDRPPKPPPRRKSFASTSNTYLAKKVATTQVRVEHATTEHNRPI
jgi:hypothetical protein